MNIKKVTGLIILGLFVIISAISASASVTIDTPATSTSYTNAATAVVMNTTMDHINTLWVVFYRSDDAGATWSLASNITNQTANQTLFNATISAANFTTDGNWTLNATAWNGTNLADQSASVSNVLNIESVAPTATMQFTDTDLNNLTSTLLVDYGDEVLVNCTPTDATAGISLYKSFITLKRPGLDSYTDNLTLTANTTSQVTAKIIDSQTRTLGEFSVKCVVEDNAGNSLNTILNFSTQSVIVGGTSPFANPDFVAPIAQKVIGKGTIEDYAGKYGALPEQGEARLIKKLGGIRFLLAEEDHEIKVEDIGDSSVTLLISSEPFTITIEVNETMEVDVNADGINDLEIYLHKIHQKAADLVFKEISTSAPLVTDDVIEAPVEEVTDVVETPDDEGKFGWLWTLLALIVVIVLLMVIIHKISGRGSHDDGKAPIRFTPRDLGSKNEGSSWGQKSNDPSKPFY